MSNLTKTRLAVINSLYFEDISDIRDVPEDTDILIENFKENSKNLFLSTDEEKLKINKALFNKVYKGVINNKTGLDTEISKYLSQDWEFDRLGFVMHAVLRAASFELIFCKDTPFKAVINEYINLSKLFFEEKEVKFVNGILEKIYLNTKT